MKGDGAKGHLELVLLGVLAAGPGHGYSIISALKARTDGVLDLPEGSVYPALHRLEDLGLVASEWKPVGGRRRREYRLTDEGATMLASEQKDWARLAAAINAVLASAAPRQARPLLAGGTRVIDSPIERYLDELFVEVRRTSARDARCLLTETESHLRDAAEEATRRGMSPTDAEVEAVRRFGGARQIADGDRHRGRTDLVHGIVVSAWSLGALGAIAVGVSGLIAGVMRLAGASNEFVAGGRSTAGLSPSDCARWLSGSPHARSCAQAALDDWAWETVGYRIAFGLLGLVALGLFVIVRRRLSPVRGWAPLPPTVVDSIASTLFGISGVWLAGLGIDALIVSSGHGAGQWLSAAPVALAAGIVFGLRLVRDVSPAP